MTPRQQVQERRPMLGVTMNGRWFQDGHFEPHAAWKTEYVEVVPREVAECLAQALERIAGGCDPESGLPQLGRMEMAQIAHEALKKAEKA